MHRSLMLWPTALVAAVVLTACGSDAPDQSGTATTPTGQTTTSDDTTSEAPTSEEPTTDETTSTSDDMTSEGMTSGDAAAPVVATADTSLGTILVDGEGMTLYLFTMDSPNTSACFDECLAAWPILEGEPTAGDGADDSKLGSFAREDGTIQATYDGWPLYHFAQDSAPGDVTGQALNDMWWVIDADGAAVTGAPGDDGSSDDGYDY